MEQWLEKGARVRQETKDEREQGKEEEEEGGRRAVWRLLHTWQVLSTNSMKCTTTPVRMFLTQNSSRNS